MTLNEKAKLKYDSTILDNFYKLVHTQPSVRLTAACSTFKILAAMKRNKAANFNDHLNYCVERLVTGLASSRALARQGYATLLLEILRKHQISTERLFTIAQQKYGNISNETTKDNLLGYYLLINVVLESGNHAKTKQNSSYLEKMYKILRQLTDQKSYFDYPVALLLTKRFEIFYEHLLAEIPPAAFGSDIRLTHTELLSIALCNNHKKIPQLADLSSADILRMSEALKSEKLKRRPLHPVWIEWSKTVMSACMDKCHAYITDVVQANFFKPNHNDLAAMGLELTNKLLERIGHADQTKVVLSDYIVRLLIVSMRTRSPLRNHCIQFITTLSNSFKTSIALDFTVQRRIIEKLISPPGSLTFDEDSKSQSLINLLNNCNPEVLKSTCNVLIMKLDEKMSLADSKRFHPVIGKLLAHIIRRPQLSKEPDHMIRMAKFLIVNSLFSHVYPLAKDKAFWKKQDIMPAAQSLDEAAKTGLRSAYHAAMDNIVSSSDAQSRIAALGLLVDLCHQLIHASAVGFLESTGDITKVWQHYMVCLIEYRKLCETNGDPKILYSVSSLYLLYGLQIVEHGFDCKDQLGDLYQAAQDALKNDPSDGSWADILTDQIISILSATECNPWIRKLCVSVFGSLLPHISETSIDLVCDVMRTPLDSTGDDEEEEDEDEAMEDADNGEEVKVGEEGAEDEDEDDDDDDDDEEEGEDEEQEGEDEKMDCAEGQDREQKEEDKDNKDGEEEEEYLDDEQMMKLDSVLVDMFKLNRVGKKKRRDPSFKLRCLDLIKKVIAKKHNDAEIIKKILATIVPLAAKSRKSVDTKPISDKIDSMIAKMPGKGRASLA